MLKCRKDARLAVALCVFTVTAWAGPIIIPVPGAPTAAPPPPAYGAPGASTGTASVIAIPPSVTAPKPAAAAPPPSAPPPPAKPTLDYSYLDAAALLVQPFGNEDVGHGERITLSDALSERAFLILDGARFDSVGEVRHSFDIGMGLNTSDDTGRSFYATFTWTGIGFQTQGTPSDSGHGYAVTAGVRVLPMASMELNAEARYDNNHALDGHTSGRLGMLYQFHSRLWVGLTLGTNAIENDYLLTLRWMFGKQ